MTLDWGQEFKIIQILWLSGWNLLKLRRHKAMSGSFNTKVIWSHILKHARFVFVLSASGAKELSHSHVNQNESQRFTFNPLRLSMIDPYGGLATIRKSTTANGAALTDPRDTAVQRDMQVGSKRWHFLLVWIERCHEARATEVRFKPGGEVWRGEWQKEGWRHAHNAFLSPFTNGPEATWNLNPLTSQCEYTRISSRSYLCLSVGLRS